MGIVCAPKVMASYDRDFGGKLPGNNRNFCDSDSGEKAHV
jgi:hypothetical protein